MVNKVELLIPNAVLLFICPYIYILYIAAQCSSNFIWFKLAQLSYPVAYAFSDFWIGSEFVFIQYWFSSCQNSCLRLLYLLPSYNPSNIELAYILSCLANNSQFFFLTALNLFDCQNLQVINTVDSLWLVSDYLMHKIQILQKKKYESPKL